MIIWFYDGCQLASEGLLSLLTHLFDIFILISFFFFNLALPLSHLDFWGVCVLEEMVI